MLEDNQINMYDYFTNVAISATTVDRTMSIGACLGVLGDCEQLQLDNDSYIRDFFVRHNIGIYLVSRYVEIVDMPQYKSNIRTHTSIYKLSSACGYRNTYIYDDRDNILVRSYAMGAFIYLDSGKIARVSQNFLNGYELCPQLDMEYPPRKIQPTGILQECGCVVVTYSFLDIYGHVNNVKYVALACDYVENISRVRATRVEYRKSAMLGDTMYVRKYVDNSKVYIQLYNCSDVYAIIEFDLDI
ncbi:MAG: hypothetical protein LBK70_01420 [Clostridiales bacterium]|jgi:acyl-ACP thioesterase|nr:hypothetical protein [Clostridiales bacterium]